MTPPYAGYIGQVWRIAYNSLAWLSATMTTADNAPVSVAAPAEVVYATLRNAIDCVSAFTTLTVWTEEIKALQSIQVLPLGLDATTAAYLNARVSVYANATAILKNSIPAANVSTVDALLTAGIPAIADPGLLNFYTSEIKEIPPAAFTSTPDIVFYATQAANAWLMVAQAISAYQGASVTQAYDTAFRQYEVSSAAATMIAGYESGSPLGSTLYTIDSNNYVVVDSSNLSVLTYGDTLLVWNNLVTMYCMTTDAAILSSAPYNNQNQQSGVIRNALIYMQNQLSLFLLSLRKPAIGVTNVGTLLNNDTLLDFAARETGNFENWVSIANANNLLPPWVGTDNYGKELFIPAPGSAPPTPGVVYPTYAANVLGVDIYIGPINGSMPPWTGDYQLVTGYANLQISLGRRLQTTLGSLIYHSDFGSRIPPEVGNVQDTTTAGHIAAYGQSALISDPRVDSVIAATATIQPGGLGLVSFTGTVIPIGRTSDAVTIDETISPLA